MTPVRLFAITLLVLAALHRAAAADCVDLRGDPVTIDAIGELLGVRGIALDPACEVAATIEPGADQLAIHLALSDGSTVDRVVAEAHTAATVIESFVRADIGSSLLVGTVLPPPPPPREDAPRVVLGAPAPAPSPRGVHVFGAFETSFGNDRTGWIGGHVGACVMLGPVCGAARLRHASVISGPDIWSQTERRNTELLVGIDLPFAAGPVLVSPGFAAGIGVMHTRGVTHDMRAETGGLRADVHATLSVPVWRKLALDIFVAADLTQEAHVEWGPEMVPLPPEPRLLVRFGAGLRYEGL